MGEADTGAVARAIRVNGSEKQLSELTLGDLEIFLRKSADQSTQARKHIKSLRQWEPDKTQEKHRLEGNGADVARKVILNKL